MLHPLEKIADLFQLIIVTRCEMYCCEIFLKGAVNEIIFFSLAVHDTEVVGKVKEKIPRLDSRKFGIAVFQNLCHVSRKSSLGEF